MIIYAAMVFSCVTIGGSNLQDGDGSYTKACTWTQTSVYFLKKERCEQVLPKVGSPIGSDMMDGGIVERAECREVTVYE